MAPDKIYVPQHNIEAGTIYELCEFVVGGSVEYIRKDALLEWAKEKKKQLLEQESVNNELSDVAVGINAGLDIVIRKLNSM